MLEFREISKAFLKTDFILKDITCRLNTGLHLLVGPNGSGKSTFLRMAAGIMKPGHGIVLYQNQDIYVHPVWYKYRLGYLPQNFAFYSHMTGKEYLFYLANLKGIFGKEAQYRVSYTAELLGIEKLCSEKISTWSVGMRQCLGIAQSLLNDPDVLILDEPLCSLAFEESSSIRELLCRLAYRKVIVMSSHLTDDLPVSHLLMLVNGTLCFNGTADTFIRQTENQVWTGTTGKDCWMNIRQDYPDSTVIFTERTCSFRIISSSRPALPDIKSALPSLEEAYLIHMRKLDQNGTGT